MNASTTLLPSDFNIGAKGGPDVCRMENDVLSGNSILFASKTQCAHGGSCGNHWRGLYLYLMVPHSRVGRVFEDILQAAPFTRFIANLVSSNTKTMEKLVSDAHGYANWHRPLPDLLNGYSLWVHFVK
jgi:hypothetical protein